MELIAELGLFAMRGVKAVSLFVPFHSRVIIAIDLSFLLFEIGSHIA